MAHSPIGIILSAGFGTRLLPLTKFRPKPVMEVLGKPIIYYLIKMLEDAGVKDIIINLHHHAEQLSSVVKRYNCKSRIHFVFEKEILNTAGGIANALRSLGISDRSLIVIHGDIFCEFDIAQLFETKDFCRLICDEYRPIEGYLGSVGVDDQGHIVELGKFYTSGSSSARRGFFTGIHVLSPSAVELVTKCHRESLVAEVYPQWLKEGHVLTGVIKPLVYDDLGTAQRFFNRNMMLLNNANLLAMQKFLEIKPYSFGTKIYTGDNVRLENDINLIGPLIIGSGVNVSAGASLGPNVIVGEHCSIGADAKISNSIVMSRTTIENYERMDCTIAMSDVRVLVK